MLHTCEECGHIYHMCGECDGLAFAAKQPVPMYIVKGIFTTIVQL